MIYAIAIFIFGLLLFFAARKLDKPLRTYEFENRTDAGLVRFESLKESDSHNRKRAMIGIVALTLTVA